MAKEFCVLQLVFLLLNKLPNQFVLCTCIYILYTLPITSRSLTIHEIHENSLVSFLEKCTSQFNSLSF